MISLRIQRLADRCEQTARSYDLAAYQARKAGLFVKYTDGVKDGHLVVSESSTTAMLDKSKPIISTKIP